MSRILLDIGSGDSSFVVHFQLRNPTLCSDFLCGEPSYPKPWHGPLWWKKIHKVRARYENFEIADSTVDIVTLNAYHPFTPPRGIISEVVRCLRPGGVFISAHPIDMHPSVETHLLVDQCPQGKAYSFQRTKSWLGGYEVQITVRGFGVIRYPASPTIQSRLALIEQPEMYKNTEMLNGYIYRSVATPPGVRVWQRQ